MKRNLGPPVIYLPARRSRRRAAAVLLQGFGTGGRAMEWIARDLEAQGIACAIPRLGGLLGYLQTRRVPRAGRTLADFLHTGTGAAPVWIIGHSIGGIIARYAVQLEDAGARVAGVITLGTPHRGTPVAAVGVAAGLWAISRAPLDVLPRSPILNDLNLRPWPVGMPLISIAGMRDLLCPPACADVPFAGRPPTVRNVRLAGLGHTELLWNRAVRRMIVAEVLGPTDRPSPNPQE